jgi:hypothetical protein
MMECKTLSVGVGVLVVVSPLLWHTMHCSLDKLWCWVQKSFGGPKHQINATFGLDLWSMGSDGHQTGCSDMYP